MIFHHLIDWTSENHPLSIQCVHTGAYVLNRSNTVESHLTCLYIIFSGTMGYMGHDGKKTVF